MRVNRRQRSSKLIYFSPDDERVKRFRKRFKVGDKIKAKILEIIGENRAIILVDGVKLIAYLKEDISREDIIYLEVKQLFPHIVLKQSKENKGLSLYI